MTAETIGAHLDELERLGKNLDTTQPFVRETILENVAALREKLKLAMEGGAALIMGERLRQLQKEGWTAEHDDRHGQGELLLAALGYAATGLHPNAGIGKRVYVATRTGPEMFAFREAWPRDWEQKWDKRERHSPMRRLAIAGALIAAEMDRLERDEARAKARARPPG